MKRTLSFALAMLMVLTIVPASLLSVLARGPGVIANGIDNQSITQHKGQYIPETVVVDGKLDDTAWPYEDWKFVNSDSGTWDVQKPSTVIADFSYKYQLKVDYYYLYGAIVIDTDAIGTASYGDATIWFNDGTLASAYTDKFVADFEAKTLTRTTYDGQNIEMTSDYAFEDFHFVFSEDGSDLILEFKCLLADFCPEKNPNLKYFVSCEATDGVNTASLYHPIITVEDSFDRDACFPSDTSWPAQGGYVISAADVRGNGDHSLTVAVDVDGKINEAIWAPQTDFYSKWYERSALVNYIEGEKPFADLTVNTTYYKNYFAAKHDIRVMLDPDDYLGNKIFGAMVIYDGLASTSYEDTAVAFELVDEDIGTLYIQITHDYLSSSGYRKATAYWYDTAGTLVGTYADNITYAALPLGGPNLYTIEFSFDLADFPNFVPDYYYFTGCAYPDSVDNDSDGLWVECDPESDTDYGNNADTTKFYPVHFKNQLGVYYKPYTTYSVDGTLGRNAWPALSECADYYINRDIVGDDTRLQGVKYLPLLRADLDYSFGSVLVRVDDGITWVNGTASEPGSGDHYDLWLLTAEGNFQQYSIWTDEDGNAVIGSYSDGVYYPDTTGGMQAKIVHYDNKVRDYLTPAGAAATETNDFYLIEYRIPHTDTGISLDINNRDYFNETAFTSESENIIMWYSHGLTLGSGTLYFPSYGVTEDPTVDTFSTDCAQKLNWHDVVVEATPDGRIVEGLRVNLDKIDYTNSEYREKTVEGNYFNYYYALGVANRYIYFGGYVDEELTDDTAITLWFKSGSDIYKYVYTTNADGSADNLAFYKNGVLTTANSLNSFGLLTANQRTTIEAAIPVSEINGSEGFEYFVEVHQHVNDEHLTRVTPKIELPDDASYPSNFLNGAAWIYDAKEVPSVAHFPNEEIVIDGQLNDNGWDGAWTYVTYDVNASIQETTWYSNAFAVDMSSFYYQMRTDDEFLYVAAVVYYTDDDGNGDAGNKTYDYKPTFRLWIKDGKNGNNVYNGDSNTYTKIYDLTYGETSTGLKVVENILPTYPNNVKPLYNKFYTPVIPNYNEETGTFDKYANGMFIFNVSTSEDIVWKDHNYLEYGDSFLFGYSKDKAQDNEAVVVDPYTGPAPGQNLGEWRNPGDTSVNVDGELWPDAVETEWEDGLESGIMTEGSGKTVNGLGTLPADTAVVEFKVSFEEMGLVDEETGEIADFQYYIQSEAFTSWAGGHCTTMYPAIVSAPGSASNYFHYNYPFWKWQDGLSITVTEEAREAMALRINKKPVITLGAKVNESYTYNEQPTNAIRFGGLWTEEYIRKVNGLDKTDGYNNGNYTDYWDVKAMGMVILPTNLVGYNNWDDKDAVNSEHPGRYDLFIDTENAVWVDADGIVSWHGPDGSRNNFADYEKFAFYVTLVNVPDTARNFCFRGFVEYYAEPNGSIPYYDVILERSMDQVIDQATGSDDQTKEDGALDDGNFEDDEINPGTGAGGNDKVEDDEGGETETITPATDVTNRTIAYVPLDNRPVNVDRVEYLAAGADFDLRMPDAADYTTIMDGNVNKDSSLTNCGGNPENILKWLKSQEAGGVNNYVISLDQMFSGGLVTSRLDTEFTTEEYEIADYIIQLASDPENRVVLNDTVMRLAPETDYNGFTLEQYNTLREYGDIERLELTGSDLNVENIIANYNTDINGNAIAYDASAQELISQHLAARARKLRIIDYIMNGVGNSADHLFIAVDDSSRETNIQRNDRAYIKALAESKGIEYTMFAGTDEVGLLGVAALAGDIYQNGKIPVNLVYFGNGKDQTPADQYDYQSLDATMQAHLDALGAYASNDANALQILVLTYEGATDPEGNLTGYPNTEAITSAAAELLETLQYNLANNIPTCVIDCSNINAGNSGILSEALLGDDAWYETTYEGFGPNRQPVTTNTGYDFAKILSYSCWNTIGNTIGIGLSNAIGRYSYIYSGKEVTHESNLAFLESLVFAVIKDQTYRQNVSIDRTTGYGYDANGGYFDLDSTANYDDAASILAKLNMDEHREILAANGEVLEYNSVSISNVSWPWERAFECRFDIAVDMDEDQWDAETVGITAMNPSDYSSATGDVNLFYSSDYTYMDDIETATSGNVFQWWNKVLLEYDDDANNYKVIAVDVNTTAYTEWTIGIDRIAIATHSSGADANMTSGDRTAHEFVAGLTVGQRLELVDAEGNNVAASDISDSGDYTLQTTREKTTTTAYPAVVNKDLGEVDYNNLTVAYVPLDDRPVHTDRVKYLASASGITLTMPEEEDYATVLGTDGHGGNTANILSWLEEQEAAGVNYYVIALDQVFSGGLVNSRYSDSSYNGSLVGTDLTTVKFLTNLAKSNYVVFTDTVMRLASTSGYRDHDATLYEALRAYGMETREEVADDVLTIDNVISSYRYDDSGVTAIERGTDEENIKGYLAARERKLRIIDYLIKNAGGNIDRLFIGIDDSSSGNNLQYNEIKYIKSLINDPEYKLNGTVFAGADEMGLMGIAAVTANIYPAADDDKGSIPVNVTYYGPAADAQADNYDNGTLRDSVDLHLQAIGAVKSSDANALQILVLTRGTTDVSYTDTTYAPTYAAQLVAQLKTNLDTNVPTVVIDASNHYGGHANILTAAMLDGNVFGRTDFTELLGYSAWNTVGNAVGIGLSNAIARYSYIMNSDEVTADSNVGFLQGFTFALVKDIAYKSNSALTWDYETGTYTANDLVGYVNAGTTILGIDGADTADGLSVELGTITWPWARAFEARIEVTVK